MLYFEFRSDDRLVSRKNNHEIKTLKSILANFDLMKNAAIRRSNNSISSFDLMKIDLLTLTHKAESEFVMKKNKLPKKNILEKTFASFFLAANFHKIFLQMPIQEYFLEDRHKFTLIRKVLRHCIINI
jgi:hypothetical protein